MAESREFESDDDYEQKLNEYYEETYGNGGQDEEMGLHESENKLNVLPAAYFSTLSLTNWILPREKRPRARRVNPVIQQTILN